MKKCNLFFTGLLLISSFTMAACNKNTSSSDSSIITGLVSDYNINISAISGRKLSGLAVEIYKDNKLVKSVLTDENGDVSFSISDDNYTIDLPNLDEGYYLDKELKLTAGTYDYDFVIPSKVIEKDAPNDKLYTLQDVMYDFTVTTSDGEEYTLSEELETHDAVLINFWYTTCAWCLEEFPELEQAYQNYSDDISIIALSQRDMNPVIDDFKYEMGLSFPMAYDSEGITQLFGIQNFPTSIMIDRYGIVAYGVEGAFSSQEEIEDFFNMFIGDDYIPVTSLEESDGTERIPTVSMPASSEIENAINGEGINCTYKGAEDDDPGYTWPWVVGEDGKSIHTTNSKIDYTAATIITNVIIPEGKALAFDYLISSEEDCDILYVMIDGTNMYTLSGVENNYKTCYAYVSEETKSYELVLTYYKDGDSYAGEDKAIIKNLRYEDPSSITTPTYIYRYCSNDLDENSIGLGLGTGNYLNYSKVYFNENDGYYHVNSETGPLVLADLIYATHWSNELAIYTIASNGYANIGGVNYADIINEYTAYSSNGLTGTTPVTQELYEALNAIAHQYGDPQNKNEWLEVCNYYSAYGTNGEEMQDPIKGLAIWNAYETVVGDQNFAPFTKPILPRGLKFKFEVEESGVYKINSIGDQETMCWIMDGNANIIAESNVYARKFRYEGVESKNFEMYFYFEANETYFINPAFYDYLYEGTLQFNVEYVGETYNLFTLCSPGYYTSELDANGEMTDKIISTGINYVLHTDGYYHELREDGTVGSIIYADFIYPSFLNYSLTKIIDMGAFNFKVDAEGNPVPGGVDYTDDIKKYAMRTIKDEGDLYGCIPVDEDLQVILQLLADKYGFAGVNHHWLKFCYYYQYFGPSSI